MWQDLWEKVVELGYLEWSAFLAGLIYVYLAARDHISCWIFGILSSGIWAYVSFFEYQLYLDSGLNIFYVIMGFIGWLNWGNSGGDPQITHDGFRYHFQALLILLPIAVFVGFGFDSYTDAALPHWDAVTTVFSIWATYLLIKHKIENWIYWIATDMVYVGLYYYKGAILFSILFVVYTLISVRGWQSWNSKAR